MAEINKGKPNVSMYFAYSSCCGQKKNLTGQNRFDHIYVFIIGDKFWKPRKIPVDISTLMNAGNID
jgi:hypothetical protein